METKSLVHAAVAVAAQVIVGVTTGNWWLGGALACAWFVAREHTQAEYRWIASFGKGKRANMPWWGGFDRRAWNLSSFADWVVPLAVCALMTWVIA